MEKICDGCGKGTATKIVMSSADWQRNEQRHENREKRHWILHIILVVLFIASNIGWLIYESQFEVVEETEEIYIEAEQDGSGTNIIGGGDINYGAENKND